MFCPFFGFPCFLVMPAGLLFCTAFGTVAPNRARLLDCLAGAAPHGAVLDRLGPSELPKEATIDYPPPMSSEKENPSEIRSEQGSPLGAPIGTLLIRYLNRVRNQLHTKKLRSDGKLVHVA